MKSVMFNIKGFYPSITQDLLNKALNFAGEYIFIWKCDLAVIKYKGSHYCLAAPIPGLRNKEVCLMCRWGLMMELKFII